MAINGHKWQRRKLTVCATPITVVVNDGQRFLVNLPVEANNPAPMTVVLNWAADLKH